MTKSRDESDLIKAGESLLCDAFMAMHSTVRSDRATLACRSGGWPSYLPEENKEEEEPERRVFTATQIDLAGRLCDCFSSDCRQHNDDKKLAVFKAMRPEMGWKALARARLGDERQWSYCRRVCEAVYLEFARVARRKIPSAGEFALDFS